MSIIGEEEVNYLKRVDPLDYPWRGGNVPERFLKATRPTSSILIPAPVVTAPFKTEIMPSAPVSAGAGGVYANTFSPYSGGRVKIRHVPARAKANKSRFGGVKRIARAESSSESGNGRDKTVTENSSKTKKKRPYPHWLKKFQFKKGGKK